MLALRHLGGTTRPGAAFSGISGQSFAGLLPGQLLVSLIRLRTATRNGACRGEEPDAAGTVRTTVSKLSRRADAAVEAFAQLLSMSTGFLLEPDASARAAAPESD